MTWISGRCWLVVFTAASICLAVPIAWAQTAKVRACDATGAKCALVLSRDPAAGENGILVRPISPYDQLSAVGRPVTAEAEPVAALSFNYSINPAHVSSLIVDTGAVTQASSMAVLQTGTGATGSARIRSTSAARYVAGTGVYASFSALFTAGVANSRQEIGLGDESDGVFFGYQGATFGVFLRSGGSDTFVAQSAWNGADKFDGTGPSATTLDKTKLNLFKVQFSWHGAGTIRYYISDPTTGRFALVHQIVYENTATVPSFMNPTLPLHAKVVNTGNASNVTLKTASMGAYVEGNSATGPILIGWPGADYGITTATGTEAAILTLKNKPSNVFGGINVNRVRTKILRIGIANPSGAKDMRFLVKLNATLGGTPNYVDSDTTTSVIAVDKSGTTVSGGRLLGAVRLASGASENIDMTPYNFTLNPGDTATFSAQNATDNTPLDAELSVSWLEMF